MERYGNSMRVIKFIRNLLVLRRPTHTRTDRTCDDVDAMNEKERQR